MNNQVFNTKGAEIEIQAFHPGEFLLEEIEEREILKKDLAQALEILPNNLSLLFAGKRRNDAAELGDVFPGFGNICTNAGSNLNH